MRTFPGIEAVLRPDAATQPLLRELLGTLEDLGCVLSPPPAGAQRHDYVNVTPGGQRGRILSVHGATGRCEFQSGSWDRVGHLAGRFTHLAGGNKAAHPLGTHGDVEAILHAARIELGFRGGPRARR